MTNDHNVRTLGDELHDLAGDIAPSPAAARDRARRGIARHTRNRRAALGTGVAVVVIAATAVFAVGRTDRDSQRPIGTTPRPTVSAPPNVVVTTTTPASSAPTTNPGSPVLSTIPRVIELSAATASYEKTFPWGTNDNEVAFHTPQGEGASGGPLAFTADAAGNIVMLDHSSGRIVRLQRGASSSNPVSVSPAVTAAVFDTEGRVIVATVGDLAVYLPSGALQKDFGTVSQTPIRSLDVVDGRVYAVETDPYQSANLENTRTQLLRPDGAGYAHVDNPPLEQTAIQIDIHPEDSRTFVMRVSVSGREYRITASNAFNAVSRARLLPDGTLAFVLHDVSSGQSPDSQGVYVLGRVAPDGHADYRTLTASMGYLVNGPGFVINDDGLAVMSSTTTGGVTVSYYPFD